MIGQWIYVFFHRRHAKVRNRPTILVSLESTGPYQRNDASLVLMRCVVLEIQMIMIPALQKFPVTRGRGEGEGGNLRTRAVACALGYAIDSIYYLWLVAEAKFTAIHVAYVILL